MTAVDAQLLAQLPLTDIARVMFYKRDEITTDLICCDVVAGGRTWAFHEDQVGWDLLLQHLSNLPNFRTGWHACVSQPPFATSDTVAFERE